MPELAKILIGNEQLSEEEELDQKFTEVFVTMCKNGIPVWGFLNDEIGQWMYGPMDCFQQVFGDKYVIFRFNIDTYIANTNGPFWLAQLDVSEPMKSKLLKYFK